MVGELRAPRPSECPRRMKQNASPGEQSEAPKRRRKPGQEQHPGAESQDSQHMLNQPRQFFPEKTIAFSQWRAASTPCKNQRIAKGAGGKGPRQKTSKIVKKCQKVFRHFSTVFARHLFSGPFCNPLKKEKEYWNGRHSREKKKQLSQQMQQSGVPLAANPFSPGRGQPRSHAQPGTTAKRMARNNMGPCATA